MEALAYRVSRVFSNNAVLARLGEDERVLVGRGIGYGRRVGESIADDQVQQHFLAVSSSKARYLDLMDAVDQQAFDVCVEAIEQAADLLGELHPSVYLVLGDHLTFAVQRLREGGAIPDASLVDEIRVAFPDEFAAAEVVARYINAQLGVELPPNEAAFITLHLNAARTSVSVKAPLKLANTVAGIVRLVEDRLGLAAKGTVHDQLVRVLAALTRRVLDGAFRSYPSPRSIERDLPLEFSLAFQVVERIWGSTPLPHGASGEVAHLAVFLNGWKQDAGSESQLEPAQKNH